MWVNPLGWQDDDERALLLPGLYERSQGRTHYDATAVKVDGVRWRVCRWINSPASPNAFTLQCYWADEPPPPEGPTISACPNWVLPETMRFGWYVRLGPNCPTWTTQFMDGTWNGSLAGMGGWEATFLISATRVRVRLWAEYLNGNSGPWVWRSSTQTREYLVYDQSEGQCGVLPTVNGVNNVFPPCPSTYLGSTFTPVP